MYIIKFAITRQILNDDDDGDSNDDDGHLASTIVVVNGDLPMELSVQPGALCA